MYDWNMMAKTSYASTFFARAAVKQVVVYKDEVPVGYTITFQEADAICLKYPNYQWNFSNKPINLPLLTISSFDKDISPSGEKLP